MSLVNDMLRDLDARRRDNPAQGPGAEKLIPATDKTTNESRIRGRLPRSVLMGTAMLLGMLVLFAAYLVLRPQPSTNLPDIRFSDSAAQSDLTSAEQGLMEERGLMVEPEMSAGISPAAATEQVTATGDSARERESLALLEARLRQLEEQNRVLLESRQAESQLQSGNQSARHEEVPGFNFPVIEKPYVTEPVSEPAPARTAATDAVRTPRTLSFSERDRQQVQVALQQWSSGQQLTALQTLDRFAFENPEAHASRETLAKLLIQQGETQRALQAVDVGLQIAPGRYGYRKIKARLLLDQGQADSAVNILSDVAPSISMDPEFHDLLASAYLAAERYDSAVQTYRVLLQQDASVGRWWYGLAAAMDASARPSEAMTAYERALQSTDLSIGLRQVSQERFMALRQNYAN